MITVLTIDDDPDMLASLRTILLTAGFTVIAAGSAREAMDRLAFAQPDVIVTDVFMPGGDGFDLMAALRRAGSIIPVIMISGGARELGPHQLEIATELGAAATIAKPFRGRDLVETIKRVAAEHGNDPHGG